MGELSQQPTHVGDNFKYSIVGAILIQSGNLARFIEQYRITCVTAPVSYSERRVKKRPMPNTNG